MSGAPPADGLLEPLWAPALMMCIGVSSIVFAFALLAARVAGATHVTVAVPIAECAQQSCEHP